MYIIIIPMLIPVFFISFLLNSFIVFNIRYIVVAITNIKLFILIILAIDVKIVAMIINLYFLLSIYFIVKYTANKHNAKLGISPYMNVVNIINGTNVSISINGSIVLVLYCFDNCLVILYIATTINTAEITFTILNTPISSKNIILKIILYTNDNGICCGYSCIYSFNVIPA